MFLRSSANCNDCIVKLSSPRLRCWSIQVIVCWLNDWASWMSSADRNGCHGFHCSEYLQCLVYNLVALPYAFPPAFSTATSCLWPFVLVGSGGQVRVYRFFVVNIVRWWCTRSIVYELIINWQLVNGHSGAPTVVKPWWLKVIPASRW